MFEISQKDFAILSQFVQKNYGINLSHKKSLIENRLTSTLVHDGYQNFSDYVRHITEEHPAQDIDIMLNKLTTNYTYFMRESEHFEYFKSTILPWIVETRRDKTMCIWSAGCSSGEEPYTLSMIIQDFLGNQASLWDTRLLATDISQEVLSKAKAAQYPSEALKGVSEDWKKKYFVKQYGHDSYTVAPRVRSDVIFRTFNLMSPIRFRSNFDVIFCRNVMIYFDGPTRDSLVNRFYNATNPGGYLLIGHSESINKSASSYHYIKPATYRKL